MHTVSPVHPSRKCLTAAQNPSTSTWVGQELGKKKIVCTKIRVPDVLTVFIATKTLVEAPDEEKASESKHKCEETKFQPQSFRKTCGVLQLSSFGLCHFGRCVF